MPGSLRPSRAAPLLVFVFDRTGIAGDVALGVTRLVDAGVDRLQVRDRSLEAAALFAFTREVVAGARAAARTAHVIVNRRVDIALAAGADGVHLGFDAVDVASARALIGERALIGVSCHDLDEVSAAAARGADYLHLAPIFDPRSKPAERPPLGLDVLAEACASDLGAGLDVVAQGGLDARRVAGVLAAGARGIAVTGAVSQAPAPEAAVAELRRALDAAVTELRRAPDAR